MQGRPLINFNEREASRWASKIVWIGLKIINSSQDDCEKHIGFVEFIAAYLEKDNLKTIHEHSQFQRTNDHWFYIEGQMISTLPKKISRNAPCPCGSQKKFKNCHALN